MIKEIKTKLSSFEIFTIFRNEENSFILDSAMDKKKLGRFSFISSNPFKVLKYKNTLNNPLDNLQEELKKYKVENKTHLPFIGGAVGYLSYDLGNYIVLHVNKPLTGETLFKGIKKIYLNSYGYNEENVMDILEQVREINKQKQEKVFPIRKKLNSDGTIDVIMNETNKFEFNLKNKEL